MDPYQPCWCQSGKKWKFCHKVRQTEQPLARVVLELQGMEHAQRHRICLHPKSPVSCSGKIARAHTVQKKRGLSAIAEDGHVLSMKDGLRSTEPGKSVKPRRVGIGNASTFYGFCQKHDAELFKLIDTGSTLVAAQAAFLTAYRSLCYELYQKDVGVATARFFRDNIDRGYDFYGQFNVQNEVASMIFGFEEAVKDFKRYKADFDAYLNGSHKKQFSYYCEVYDEVLPIAVSTAFNPEFGFSGGLLQTLDLPIGELEILGFNLSTVDNKTTLTFGWFGKAKGACEQFVREFAALPKARRLDALLVLSFEFTEHIFLRPSWWESLTVEQQDSLAQRWSNTPGSHNAQCLSLKEQKFGKNGNFERFMNLSL